MGTHYIFKEALEPYAFPSSQVWKEYSMVDISLTGLPGCGVVFLLHFEDELALSSCRRCGGRAAYSSIASVKCLQGSQSRGERACALRVHSVLAACSFLPCGQNSLWFP